MIAALRAFFEHPYLYTIGGFAAFLLVRSIVLSILDRCKPRTCWVWADRTPFTGMNTGAPGATDPLVLGERLTPRRARQLARRWVARHEYGSATIYVNDAGTAPADLTRWNSLH